MYEELTAVLPRLEDPAEWGSVGTVTGIGMADDPIRLPVPEYGPAVRELERATYRFVDEHPEYELDSYPAILEQAGLGSCEAGEVVSRIKSLDGKVAMALLLREFRAERYCDGALRDSLESGIIQALLKRLTELDEKDVHKG
jgi:hypothetical protein